MNEERDSGAWSNRSDFQGLTEAAVLDSRERHGSNRQDFKRRSGMWDAVAGLAREPMILLLMAAATVYFIGGQRGDGFFMVTAIFLVGAISIYQDSRSRIALEKLQEFTRPSCRVVRDGRARDIPGADVVVGDILLAEEGTLVAADGVILQSNDFSVNESLLTGESLAVQKDPGCSDPNVYAGTGVATGLAVVRVTAVGAQTRLGTIGKSLETIRPEATPLERQINHFVRMMAIAGIIIFLIVWTLNYQHSGSVADSLLKALTLAMSILPEEIPVAFTTFMALGAWRLMKSGVVVKQMKTVETLGSATVICVDKTGTITENRMTLARLWLPDPAGFCKATATDAAARGLIRMGMWASEPIPFDAMEISLHEAYAGAAAGDERPRYRMVHEYPLGGRPPMMTHVFEDREGHRIIAAKGAPEAILDACGMDAAARKAPLQALQTLATEGYRVLAVAEGHWDEDRFPAQQQQLPFTFKGLLAFYDPPKANISGVLRDFYRAGIKVKIVTGDVAATTAAIAGAIGFRGTERQLQGDELMQLDDDALAGKVSETDLFSRVFPDAKLRIINALKRNREIVAMTGDGINDGPALKAAHIGIAMGKKGTELARQAAGLILLEDDLGRMVEAVALGRKIYSNLKKAIQYIVAIHIPILLTVFVPLALGWIYPNIFSPVHVIFLELIMGPTCSIVYENEPIEPHAMSRGPRPFSSTFFRWRELAASIVQGLVIAAAVLLIYRVCADRGGSEDLTRTVVFTALVAANIALTLVNRSGYDSVTRTLKFRNRLVWPMILLTTMLTILLLVVPAFSRFFGFVLPSPGWLFLAVVTGTTSVAWLEIQKWYLRRKDRWRVAATG
jgi:Ca2+-transporting ATPase